MKYQKYHLILNKHLEGEFRVQKSESLLVKDYAYQLKAPNHRFGASLKPIYLSRSRKVARFKTKSLTETGINTEF